MVDIAFNVMDKDRSGSLSKQTSSSCILCCVWYSVLFCHVKGLPVYFPIAFMFDTCIQCPDKMKLHVRQTYILFSSADLLENVSSSDE